MLYESKELKPLYNKYLENRTHKWKPYTQYWFSLLLLEVNTPEDIWTRERLPPNKRKLLKPKKREIDLYRTLRLEWNSMRICEEVSWISTYLYNRACRG